jgi:4-amino-4-deoxy-L-arabinose transferase-like glycosyltransferase
LGSGTLGFCTFFIIFVQQAGKTRLTAPIRFSERAAFILLMLVAAALLAAYAVRTAPYQSPDEPAHVNVIAQIAASGCCPVIAPGDWDQAYLNALTSAEFAPELLGALDTIQYEDHQPPLYYLLLSPVYALADGSLTALRLASAAIGLGVIAASYFALRVLARRDRWFIAWTGAAVIALVPQHLAILASVNNDGLAELVVAVGVLLALKTARGEAVPAWALGLVMGIGFLTKANTFLLGGVLPLALLIRAANQRDTTPFWPAIVRAAVLFAVPALALGALWWLRNIGVYGFPDVLGLRAHDAVVVGQPRTREIIAQRGAGQTLVSAVQTTFNSFWGQFGWMAFPLPAWCYAVILALHGAAGAGWLLRLRGNRLTLSRRADVLIMGALAALALAQFLYYNLEFYQVQGRYLFPLMLALGAWFAFGLDGLGRLTRRAPWLPALAGVGVLLALNGFIVWRVLPVTWP